MKLYNLLNYIILEIQMIQLKYAVTFTFHSPLNIPHFIEYIIQVATISPLSHTGMYKSADLSLNICDIYTPDIDHIIEKMINLPHLTYLNIKCQLIINDNLRLYTCHLLELYIFSYSK